MAHAAYAQFYALHKGSPEAALWLVKTWVERASEDDTNALHVLGEEAPESVLDALFAALPREISMRCYAILSRPFSDEAVRAGYVHMSREVQAVVSWKDSVSEAEFLEIASADARDGAVLVSVFSSERLSVIFEVMPAALFARVSQSAASLLDTDLTDDLARIKAKVLEIRLKQQQRASFLRKSIELIPNAAPEKEISLYRMLLKAGAGAQARATALSHLPAALLTQVPTPVLSSILTRMSATDRAELVASQPAERAEFLLACLGEKGSKSRLFVETEIAAIRKDLARNQALQEDSGVLWSALVGAVRQRQGRDLALLKSLEPIVDAWVSELSSIQEAV